LDGTRRVGTHETVSSNLSCHASAGRDSRERRKFVSEQSLQRSSNVIPIEINLGVCVNKIT
jgi:hypothetical protein